MKPRNNTCFIHYLVTDYGFFKLEAKTKTESGVEFTTSGSSSSDTGKVCGNLETKYKWDEYGECAPDKYKYNNCLHTYSYIEPFDFNLLIQRVF